MTLFLGVLEEGLVSRQEAEKEVLLGVLRIPFRGLFTGLCFSGVSSTTGPLAAGLSRMDRFREVVGVLGVSGVLVMFPSLPLIPLLGDFGGVLFGL